MAEDRKVLLRHRNLQSLIHSHIPPPHINILSTTQRQMLPGHSKSIIIPQVKSCCCSFTKPFRCDANGISWPTQIPASSTENISKITCDGHYVFKKLPLYKSLGTATGTKLLLHTYPQKKLLASIKFNNSSTAGRIHLALSFWPKLYHSNSLVDDLIK